MRKPGRKEQLASPIWRSSIGEEVSAELQFHIEMVTRELIEAGMDERSAREEAVRRFGNLAAVRDTCRAIGINT